VDDATGERQRRRKEAERVENTENLTQRRRGAETQKNEEIFFCLFASLRLCVFALNSGSVQRRDFLKKGLLGSALLALGGGGLLLYPGRRLATPTQALRVLDERAFQVMVAIAARIVPYPGADAVVIAHAVDTALSYTAPESQADLVKLLGLFENALPGLLLDGRAAPFTRLDPDAQDRALEHWRDSRLVLRRSGYHALRRLCLGAYYADPIAWPTLHYRGPPDLGGFAHLDSKAGTS
jgi:hypothetical protein